MSQTTTIRIYIEGDELDEKIVRGLFWVKGGRAFCFAGFDRSEKEARLFRMIQEFYPLIEVAGICDVSMLEDAEECIKLGENSQIVAVRQIGRVKIGNVHLLLKKLQALK